MSSQELNNNEFSLLPKETVLKMDRGELIKYVNNKFSFNIPREGDFSFCTDADILLDYYQAVVETPGAKEWLKKTPIKEMIEHDMYFKIEKNRKIDDLSGLAFWCTVANIKFLAEHDWLRFLGIMPQRC